MLLDVKRCLKGKHEIKAMYFGLLLLAATGHGSKLEAVGHGAFELGLADT